MKKLLLYSVYRRHTAVIHDLFAFLCTKPGTHDAVMSGFLKRLTSFIRSMAFSPLHTSQPERSTSLETLTKFISV